MAQKEAQPSQEPLVESPSVEAQVEKDASALVLPVLPVRNAVLFPYVTMQIVIERQASVAAVQAALESEGHALAVFAQHDAGMDQPDREHLYTTGTRATVTQASRSERGVQLVIQGLERIGLGEITQDKPYVAARIESRPTIAGDATETEALQRELLELASRIQQTVRAMPEADMKEVVAHLDGPMHLVYLLGSMIHLTPEKAQILLGLDGQSEAMRMMASYLRHELQVLDLKKQIASEATSEINREQREYLLRRQMQAIRDELGEAGDDGSEVEELRARLKETELPEAVREEASRSLSRMGRLSPSSPELNVSLNYLELILELPWNDETEDNLDLSHAREVLAHDHFGLETIKERILEQLAVLKLNPEAKAPILCFVGPPGVGKTSLGSSIARALGRKFERLSLGGLHDESELRGHRRTYIGAMPGRLLQAVRRAGVKNPLLMLDEIDKVGRDHRGDPTAALLEILDPAQNHSFRDNYLNLPFDLSKVFFIATANGLDTLPRPLLDRMEIVRLSGYSDEEKLEIARRYLLPRRRRETGLDDDQLTLSDATLAQVIRRYTREAGVRELERTLGRLARKVALRCAEGGCEAVTLEPSDLEPMLGPAPFSSDAMRQELPPGVAPGLAWTAAGGEVLYVEAVKLSGGEQLILTGQLGDVMKESARTARSFVLSQAERLAPELERGEVHVHVPAGAIPKDGPSAGVTIATALASLYSGEPARADTAMTGEITLSGLVLPVGGVKEKVLAARRAGMRQVILPQENEKDLHDLPDAAREDLELVFAATLADV
ncbi:MAG: endopeptidase La, partial [Acidobacteriota bacterium]